MRKLLLTLSVCGLFALSSMVFYPMSDTFAKEDPTGPITKDELDAPDIILDFEGAIGYFDFSAMLENNGDDGFYVYVRVEVTKNDPNDPNGPFVHELDEVKFVFVPTHDLGPIDLFWHEETPQDLTEGVYTVTAFVCDDPSVSVCNSETNIISVSDQFEVKILGADGNGDEPVHPDEEGDEPAHPDEEGNDEPVDADMDGTFALPHGNDCDDTDPAVNPGVAEICGDGVDNDCDGLTDCDDLDCECESACAQPTETSCTNGVDDDCDGLTDCDDPDCRCDIVCVPPTTETDCTNRIDDDCDGFVDCNDTDCPPSSICPEDVEIICNDGLDNDGDGLVDCDDPDCQIDGDGDRSLAPPCGNDCDDTNPAVNHGVAEICDDGVDNDCDGTIDCIGPRDEICDDGVDNDGDGLVDCADPDCQVDVDRDGFIAEPCGNDCDDDNSTVHPGAAEICDDGVDNDCGGLVDCDDSNCVTSTTYSKGKSFIRFKHNKTSKDEASLRMCVPEAFCDIIKADPAAKEIVLTLGDCSTMTIPGGSLKLTKFGFRAKSAPGETPKYVVKINCEREWLKLRLKKLELKGCVSNPVKACVSITGIPCLCAEKEFDIVKRDKVGRPKKLFFKNITDTCSP
ncbi:MAG: MopE-related protein [Candidatus Brocadiales bacterium]